MSAGIRAPDIVKNKGWKRAPDGHYTVTVSNDRRFTESEFIDVQAATAVLRDHTPRLTGPRNVVWPELCTAMHSSLLHATDISTTRLP